MDLEYNYRMSNLGPKNKFNNIITHFQFNIRPSNDHHDSYIAPMHLQILVDKHRTTAMKTTPPTTPPIIAGTLRSSGCVCVCACVHVHVNKGPSLLIGQT